MRPPRRTVPPPVPTARAPSAKSSKRPRIGRNRIELIEIAGKGGMSTVWRGCLYGSGKFHRSVAVKHMFPHLAAQKMYREMFFEEARIGSLLQDPNIPQVYEYLVEGEDHYIVMEYIEGIDLGTYVRYAFDRLRQPVAWPLVVAIGIGVLRGLAAAHERVTDEGWPEAIVHRDVSPHNVMISAKGPAKLIDFGLSFARDREAEDTNPGVAKGKLPYLSPEIAQGHRPTPHSDQFAAGSVLWEALVGKRLFEDSNRHEAYRRLIAADVPPLRRRRNDVPKALVAVIERALQREPERRFPSARDMAKQLGDVLKESTAKEDLYATLARTVAQVRDELGLGHRTQAEAGGATPEIESGLVELLQEEDATQPEHAPRFKVPAPTRTR